MTVKFYQVGGCVRDRMLGLKPKDIDYSVEAPSYDAMRDAIEARGGRIFLETPQYHTIRAKYGTEVVDFVLCRKDGEYKDGRRPENVEMGTLMDDLARRDFTMNAMAEDEDGNLIDPFDGLGAIKQGVISCVGSAEDRFNEDALRMLRAVRFSITKGMLLDSPISEYLRNQDNVEKLKQVSIERIREELHKCFQHNTCATMEMLCIDFPALRFIFEESRLWLKPTMEKR